MDAGYKKYGLLLVVLALFAFTAFLFYFDLKEHDQRLTFAVLDVGQGDAIFIQSPSGTQILVDGGPPRSLLGKLVRMMPLFDKSIDMLIVTNPDTDHIGGFFEVIKNYKVGVVVEPGTFNDSKTYQNLENYIKSKNIKELKAERGMRLDIGGGAYIDILFPDRDVALWDTNDGSIVARLVYGETSVMLTGDVTTETEKIILSETSKDELKSTILKVAHHGSRTSSSSEFLEAVDPIYAIISNGKDNKYGHPHRETLDTLAQSGAEILRTDLVGTIVFKCDTINSCEIKKLKN